MRARLREKNGIVKHVQARPRTLTGDYKKNPVEVGSKNVDIVLEQVAK